MGADSHAQETADLVRNSYDIVFIDADHSWEGGFRDWELYGGMAPVVAIHNIVEYESRHGVLPDKHHADWFPTELWHFLKTGKTDRPLEMRSPFRTEEISDLAVGGWGVIYKEATQ